MKVLNEYDKILAADGNIVVQASAGTGKTYTLVNKIRVDLEKYQGYKDIAAITFTRKAASEIKNRIFELDSRHFIGTNNSFAVNEIIIPFIRDAFGKTFIKKSEDGKYRIETNYDIKFSQYNQGLEMISQENVIGSYRDNKKNFVFEIALNIIKKSESCQKYLKSRFFRIYIDEYQDTDNTMHEFFMYIGDILKIPLFIVGDDKQSIYVWRGAYPKQFKQLLNKENYHAYMLSINYRSCQSIQNFSNLLNYETMKFYQETNEKNVYIIVENSQEWLYILFDKLDFSKSIAILARSNNDAKNYVDNANFTWKKDDFVQIKHCPVSDITTDDSWFYEGIANYALTDGLFSEYDFIFSSPQEIVSSDVKQKIKKYLVTLKNIYHDKEQRKLYIDKISSLVDVKLSKENYKKLSKTFDDEKYKNVLKNNIKPYKHVTMTVHSSKGLEYDQVIIFAKDYSDLRNDENAKLHYVAVTRAKEKLFIVYTRKDVLYIESIKNMFSKCKLNVEDICNVIK